MNGKEIIKKLKALGWEIKSINGSHHQMIKDGVKVTVPVHGTQDVKIKTLLSIDAYSAPSRPPIPIEVGH